MATYFISRDGELKFSLLAKEPRIPKKNRPKCGARTRKGTPCRCQVLWDRGKDRPLSKRCKYHGGMSTGPRTAEGKAKVAENLIKARQRKAKLDAENPHRNRAAGLKARKTRKRNELLARWAGRDAVQEYVLQMRRFGVFKRGQSDVT